MSAGNCMVAPTPTAGPLQATMMGFKKLYILKVKTPPKSLDSLETLFLSAPLNASTPDDRSAPAQKALPLPVIITA